MVQYGERERPAAFRLAPFAEAQVAHAPRTAPSRCPKVSCFDLVALALTARAEGRAGTLALLRRIVERLAGARWYVFAVGYMAAIKLAVALLHRLATGAWPPFGQAALYIMVVAIVLSTPVQAGEEIGWRGYALPRLARHLGELR